ncbi:hypothetical protein AB2T14_002416 [Clostridium botulinum]
MPVKETEINKANINDRYVTIENELKEGDKVVINFTNKILEKDVQVGMTSFIAVKKADKEIATAISNMKAEYTAEANGHKANAEAKEVLPEDQVKLSAKILDQFGNPMPAGTTVRWVVESGKDLVTKTDDSAIDEVSDAKNFTFKAIKVGDLKISAFLANGEKVTYEVKIGAKKLAELKVAGEPGINIASVSGINHEEKIVGLVTPNKGAILILDMIKFDMKANKTSEEVKPSDVEVVAKLRGGKEDNKNDIVIAVKSSKVGKYVITPYVGESVEKGIKGDIITVTTEIDKEVIVTPDGMSKKEVGVESIKDTDKKKNVLTLKADEAKTYNVVVKNRDVIRAFNLAFTAVELGNDINGVVKGDLDTKAKYQEIKFLDQDVKAMSVNNEDIKVALTKPHGQPSAESDVSNLITLGKTYTVDKEGKVTAKAEYIVAYEVTLTGNTKGTNDVVVNVKEGEKVLATNKVSMTVDSVAVDTKDRKSLYSTKAADAKVDLNAIVKDADGTVIPVSDSDLDWKAVSQKDAEGKEKAVSDRTVSVDSKTGGVTANAGTVGSAVIEVTTANMKKATITLKFDDKDPVAQKGTVEVVNTAIDKNDLEGKKLLPLDADDKKE